MKGREEGCNQKGGTEQTDQDGKIKQNGKKKIEHYRAYFLEHQ